MREPESNNDSNRINLWIVVNDLPPHYSGAGKNVLLLSQNLLKHNVKVTLITQRHKNEKRKDKINDIKVLRIGKAGKKTSKLYWFIEFFLALIMNKKPNLILFRGFDFFYGCVIQIIKRMGSDIKIATQPAGFGTDDLDAIAAKTLGVFQMKSILKSDAIFPMNFLIKESFKKYNYPSNRLFEVKNPVKILNDNRDSNKEFTIKKKLGIPQNATIFLTVGRIRKEKRQAFITEAFCRCIVNNDHKNIFLIHVGPFSKDSINNHRRVKLSELEEEKKIQTILNKYSCLGQVIMYGYSSDVNSLMRLSDVFIHASEFEGEANVINEAMNLKIPMIISDRKLYDYQVPGNCALRFKHSCNTSLVNCINKLMKNKPLRSTLADLAKNNLLKTREPSLVAKDYYSKLYTVCFNLEKPMETTFNKRSR